MTYKNQLVPCILVVFMLNINSCADQLPENSSFQMNRKESFSDHPTHELLSDEVEIPLELRHNSLLEYYQKLSN
ncbi:MAG: hypothetical protein HQM13_16085 [SAR324 cluster bacterium]|nr:hypothetical protein [SAR324 cluster bacterium]